MESSSSLKELKRLKRVNREELPWDALVIICKTLDFEDLFQFSGVCKSWRTFHKSNILSSKEPLLVRILFRGTTSISYSFITIPNQKVYDLKIMSSFPPTKFTYVRASSRYFIMVNNNNNSFLLFNPFTRIKRVINATFRVNSRRFDEYRALLAFEKSSDDKEFVLVVLCIRSRSLYVYQSRHYRWVTYSTVEPEIVTDFVVFNNIIYVVTNNANIGVLNLNSRNIQFLNLENNPKYYSSEIFWLVNCDEQLLMFDFFRRCAYKIDLSSMHYVKMKSLGDIALFYVFRRNCQALSNPERFGYERNYVYEVNATNQCIMYNWNNWNYIKYGWNWSNTNTYRPPDSKTDFYFFDWCFRHLKYEVDYSLVE
ncbi:uncharacterized protein LOC131606225 [Vicia villosa]|uniref:uncharacterized protein LOC131606225 n=1 Tax=Vicia villosa TaxID=3911 RepID=UPI00273CD57B|nr:uncharacterized protein LOC131606225 [Vicia villosa]